MSVNLRELLQRTSRVTDVVVGATVDAGRQIQLFNGARGGQSALPPPSTGSVEASQLLNTLQQQYRARLQELGAGSAATHLAQRAAELHVLRLLGLA